VWHHNIPQSLSVQIESIHNGHKELSQIVVEIPATQKCLSTLTSVLYSREEIYRENIFSQSSSPTRVLSLVTTSACMIKKYSLGYAMHEDSSPLPVVQTRSLAGADKPTRRV